MSVPVTIALSGRCGGQPCLRLVMAATYGRRCWAGRSRSLVLLVMVAGSGPGQAQR